MNKCELNIVQVFSHLSDWHICFIGGKVFQIVLLERWNTFDLWISLSTLSCLKCFEILLLLRVSIRSTRQVGKRASKRWNIQQGLLYCLCKLNFHRHWVSFFLFSNKQTVTVGRSNLKTNTFGNNQSIFYLHKWNSPWKYFQGECQHFNI